MKCQKCKATILENDKFCPKCGTKVVPKKVIESEVKKNNLTPLYVLIGVMAGIIILLTILVYILIFSINDANENCRYPNRYTYNSPYDI